MSQCITGNILFVDDDPLVRDAVKRQFRKQFDITTAEDGPRALELLQGKSDFAVVVADLRMGQMDGVEFITRARQIAPDSVFMMLTGHAKLRVAMEALNKGHIFRFLTKPCPPDTLAEALRDALAQYRRYAAVTRYTYSVHVKDGKAIHTEYSPGCLAVSGYSPQDFESDPVLWLSIVLPEYRSTVSENANRILSGQTVGPIEFQIIRKDGRIRWMRDTVVSYTDDRGKLVRYNGLIEDITENKSAQHRLQQAAAEWRTTFDSISDPIAIVDANYKLLRANRAFARFVKLEFHELLNKNCFEVLYGRNETCVRCPFKETLRTGDPCTVETYYAEKNIYLETSTSPILDDGGRVTGCVHISRDITDRKRQEEALKESEERFRNFVETSPDVVFKVNRTGHIEYVSPRVKELYGYDVPQLTGSHFMITTPAGEMPRLTDAFKAVLAGETITNFEVSQKNASGEIVPVEINAVPIEKDGERVGVQGIMRDISERKQAEKSLRMKGSAISSSINAIAFANLDGKISYVNDAFLKMWSYDRDEEVLGKPTHSFWWSKNDCSTVVDTVLSQGGWAGELAGRRRDGSTFDAQVSASLVTDDSERPICLMASFVDVTEQRRAQEQLEKANEQLKEHDRLKSEFVSTVSHELRTPLSIFKNIISNALAGVMGRISPKLRENLVMADESISRLARIIDDFLNISKIESGKLKLNLEELDLSHLTNEVVNSMQPLAEERGIAMKSIAPGECVWVQVDYDRMVQVLTNLIGNALKFCDEEGHITVTTEDKGEEVKVSVTDDGPGITADAAQKVFDRFVQLKKNIGPGTHGTGLGLPIAKELVEMHGGKIWVESNAGEGATFSFVLPKRGPEAASVSGGRTAESCEQNQRS